MDNTNPVEQQSESSSLSAYQSTQETKVCEVCGDIGNESLLMKCSQCNVTREHTYCAEVLLPEVPLIWICEECKKSSRIFQEPPGARNQPRTPVPTRAAPDTVNDSSRVLRVPPGARIRSRSPVPARDSSRVLQIQPSARRSSVPARDSSRVLRIQPCARRSSVAGRRDNENRAEEDRTSSEISDARSVMVDLVDGAQSNLVAGDEGKKQKD